MSDNNLQIKIKYFDNENYHMGRIQKITEGDWIDLRAAEDVILELNEYKAIPLGVAMELPEGYEAHILPRSSTFKNFGIIQTNSMGIIDNSYCGDNDQWHFPALCLRTNMIDTYDHKSYTKINKGERICQFRIFKNQPAIEFNIVKHLDNEDRGGFGSTGIE